MNGNDEPLLRWFTYGHLKTELHETSEAFSVLAHKLVQTLRPTAERTVALRKLLEAKDAAVRAKIMTDEMGQRSGNLDILNETPP